uniref:C1q and TNF related 1 n=1 Tax=Anas platyrhynchos TaxID=8839 RepID=A0A8B9SI12_ANAPL
MGAPWTPRRLRPSTTLPGPHGSRRLAVPRRGCPHGPAAFAAVSRPEQRFSYPQYQPQINMTILKGEKGDRGERGMQGKYGKMGVAGSRGHTGPKGQKGSVGAPGERCKSHYAAFSVGRKKPLHSNDYYQTLIFDTGVCQPLRALQHVHGQVLLLRPRHLLLQPERAHLEPEGDLPAHHAQRGGGGDPLRPGERPQHHAEPERHAGAAGAGRGLGAALQGRARERGFQR